MIYDELAAISKANVPPAVPASLPTYSETAIAVNGAKLMGEGNISRCVYRLVKQTGQDTTLKNAIRDSAEWAWIPTGTTCAFCITLASRGWQRASKKALKGGHAEHIHANCDCAYAVRFNSQDNVYGYTPERYKLIYDSMQGKTTDGKMKALRRSLTGKNSLTLEQLEFILKLENSPSILGQKTPAEWAKYLKDLGFKIESLGRGSIKGIAFENGGGYRFHYRGDGYMQYHPPGGHHGDAYYKISSAKHGTKRYNMEGTERKK